MVDAALGDEGVREARAATAGDQFRPEMSSPLPEPGLGIEDRKLKDPRGESRGQLWIAQELLLLWYHRRRTASFSCRSSVYRGVADHPRARHPRSFACRCDVCPAPAESQDSSGSERLPCRSGERLLGGEQCLGPPLLPAHPRPLARDVHQPGARELERGPQPQDVGGRGPRRRAPRLDRVPGLPASNRRRSARRPGHRDGADRRAAVGVRRGIRLADLLARMAA